MKRKFQTFKSKNESFKKKETILLSLFRWKEKDLRKRFLNWTRKSMR